ncbi:MAG TPA: SPOR domain-containing protein [Candidatus Binatia bacterium]
MTDRSPEDKRYYFYRNQLVVLGIGFTITSVIIFVLGVMTGRHLERGPTAEPTSSGAKIPVAPTPSESAADTRNGEALSSDQTVNQDGATGSSDTKTAEESKAKKKIATAEIPKASPVKEVAKSTRQPSATKSAGERASAKARQEQRQNMQAVKKDSAQQQWTVQIKSSPDRKFADTWRDRLKAKGYDAFVAQGEVKGQTWYRVRVGHFAARADAEALRTTLESKEGLSGGFLTMNKVADTGSKK